MTTPETDKRGEGAGELPTKIAVFAESGEGFLVNEREEPLPGVNFSYYNEPSFQFFHEVMRRYNEWAALKSLNERYKRALEEIKEESCGYGCGYKAEKALSKEADRG